MAINKVIYGADTLVDLTEDTVTAEDVLNSKSFHTPDGVKRTGTASYPVTDVQVNGESVLDGTVAKVEQPTAEVKTATDTFTTVNGGLLSKCMIDLVPVQDLHGYSEPWVGGAGKNQVEATGEWNVDGEGNVTAVSGYTAIVAKIVSGKTYIISKNGVATSPQCFGYYTNYPTVGSVAYDNQRHVESITTFTAPINGYIIARMATTAQTGYQIEEGSTATAYEPYSNICPISGHTEVDLYNVGKNWFDKSIITSITGSGVEYQIQLLPNTEYTMTTNHPLSNSAAFVFFKLSGESSSTFQNGVWNNHYHTLTTGADGIAIVMVRTLDVETPADFLSYNYQIELGNTGTTFEPYNPSSHLYKVQIGSTVYGGYVDLVSGVMTVTHAFDELNGTEAWLTGASNDYGQLYYLTDVSPRYNNTITELCNWLGKSDNRSVATPNGTETGYSVGGNASYLYFFVRFDLCADLNAWKTFLSNNPLQVAYRVATPQTIQLTPQQIETLAGGNNLSTPLSGQSIETNGVEYKELFTFADVKEYVKPLIPYSNAGSHNAIYRGKYLGDHVTLEQWASIVAGTFDDLFIGDYWTINSVNWRIAHFDYWLGTGDTACTDHHVVIVPDTNLYNAKMNSTDIATGGYYNSNMRGGVNYLVSGSSGLYSASETIKSAFGSSHILTHREILTNAVSSGDASGWSWYSSSVELMSEVMVFGTLAWSVGGKGYEVGIDKEQFALFRHNISKASNYDYWWLRGVISNEGFGFVSFSGIASNSVASSSRGVRPCFAIK